MKLPKSAFNGEMPYKNQEITIQGVLYDDMQTAVLSIINNNTIGDQSVLIDDQVILEGTDDSYESIGIKYEGTAKITHISNMADNIIQEDPYISIDKSYYQEMMAYYETDYKKKDNVYYQITDMPYVNIKEVHFAKLIDMKDGTQTFLEVNASLQPVNEVVNVLRDYAIFFYLIAILISVFIALVYSKLISKPLITLTHVADKMAKMDFTIKSPLRREDELGLLSNSLNILSCNLDDALSELKEANKQLVLDMEKREETRTS